MSGATFAKGFGEKTRPGDSRLLPGGAQSESQHAFSAALLDPSDWIAYPRI